MNGATTNYVALEMTSLCCKDGKFCRAGVPLGSEASAKEASPAETSSQRDSGGARQPRPTVHGQVCNRAK